MVVSQSTNDPNMGEIKTEIKTQDFIPETSGSLKGQWNEVVPGAAAARCYTTRGVSTGAGSRATTRAALPALLREPAGSVSEGGWKAISERLQ